MQKPGRSPGPLGRYALWAALALIILAALTLLPPHDLLDKADHAAFAVCHRIPERTFMIAGRPLPLCARCSGTYLGALAGIAMLIARGRGRASGLPARPLRPLLAAFMLAWAVDGTNSFLTLIPGAPHLYPPHNTLRLITGTLEGLVIASVLLPVFNLAIWRRTDDRPSLATPGDAGWLLAAGALVVALVRWGAPILLYPLALVSGLAVLGLLGLLNTLLGITFLRREGRAENWTAAAGPLLAGIALALVEIIVITWLRAELTARFGLSL